MARPSPASAVTWPASSDIPVPRSSMLAVTDSAWSSWRPARSTAAWAPSTAACARVSRTSPRSRTSATSLLLSPRNRPSRSRTNTPTQTSRAQNTAAISAASPAAFIPGPSCCSCLLLLGLAGLGLAGLGLAGLGLAGLVLAGSAEDGPDALGALGDASLQAMPRRLVVPAIRHLVRCVTLRDDAVVEVVRVQVALTVADLARPRIVRVAQMRGHRPD